MVNGGEKGAREQPVVVGDTHSRKNLQGPIRVKKKPHLKKKGARGLEKQGYDGGDRGGNRQGGEHMEKKESG